jgi:hypothetical protein
MFLCYFLYALESFKKKKPKSLFIYLFEIGPHYGAVALLKLTKYCGLS